MVVPVAEVLIVAGLHVPGILLLDVPGRGGAAEFWQSGPICVKVGVTGAVIETEDEQLKVLHPLLTVHVIVESPAL